jgi:hypothetical protein
MCKTPFCQGMQQKKNAINRQKRKEKNSDTSRVSLLQDRIKIANIMNDGCANALHPCLEALVGDLAFSHIHEYRQNDVLSHTVHHSPSTMWRKIHFLTLTPTLIEFTKQHPTMAW